MTVHVGKMAPQSVSPPDASGLSGEVTRWLLLIYTVPSEPSRKRAAVWRDLKRAGAVYLRDGVCALPEGAETFAALQAVAEKVVQFEGQATLVRRAQIDDARAAAIKEEAYRARATEFHEVAEEAERLLEHVRRESDHRDFSFAELEELEADLGKLRRWAQQIRARNHFAVTGTTALDDLLRCCEDALAAFLEEASRRDQPA